jgi:hypothetical protein
MTRFGLNFSVTDDRDWSFFAELLAQPNSLEAPWYFVNWRTTDSVIVRIGKTRFVNWLYSETRSIGYTYPWPELPADVYRINPIPSMYGLSAEYSLDSPIGELAVELQAGSVDADFQGTNIKSDLATAGTITYQNANIKWIFSGLYTKDVELTFTPNLVPKVNANYLTTSIKAQFGPMVLISEVGRMRVAATATERESARKQAAKARAEIQSDPQKANDPILQGSIGKSIISDSAVVSASTGYLHLGYEIGNFQPYILGVHVNADKESLFVKSLTQYGGGILWLASNQVAFKLQATHLALTNKSPGLSKVPQERILEGSKDLGIRPANLVQASMDFLF